MGGARDGVQRARRLGEILEQFACFSVRADAAVSNGKLDLVAHLARA